MSCGNRATLRPFAGCPILCVLCKGWISPKPTSHDSFPFWVSFRLSSLLFSPASPWFFVDCLVAQCVVTNDTVDKYTSYVYTHNKIPDDFSDPAAAAKVLPVVFQGDSKRVLQSFPDGVKNDLGYALYRLQLGQTPPDRKPVQTVGAGVYELREGDARAWYRILYVRREKVIQVLHCFEKRSNAIEQKDIETAKTRLKRVPEAEREEKKNAKQALRRK